MSGASSRERLLDNLTRRAAHPAIEWNGRSYSFEEISRLSRLHAARLAALGIRRGDRVAVFAETGPAVIAAFIGHLESGVIHVPINTRYKADEARHILEDSGAVAVLVGDAGEECHGVLEEILRVRRPPQLREVIPIAEDQPAAGRSPSSPSKKTASSNLASWTAPQADSDVATLIYTSGTTGKSKGVALSYRALAANTASVTGLWRFSGEDRLLLALPLFHVHGLCLGVGGMLVHGLTLLLEPRFDAERVVDAFASRGATVFMGVPTMYVRLLQHLEAHPRAAEPLRKARLFTAGSAALPADDFDAFRSLTGHAILERYGMSETLFTLSNPYDGERRAGTVGLPTPGAEVRIVDDEGRDVADGELGEIVVRSDGMMNGYWGREAETAASFRDGWFLTGDVARFGAGGYVTIAGRKSVDVIKSGGYKIAAREIEDVLRRHPSVRDAAVVGVEDRLWGQRIAAAVVLVEGCDAEATCREILAFAGAHLADFKKPRDLRALPDLPRNAMGKIQKHLVAKALALGGRGDAPLDAPPARKS